MMSGICKIGICAHFVSVLCPSRESQQHISLKGMVGTSGFEPLTSTVSTSSLTVTY
jgi:hypothetical protein